MVLAFIMASWVGLILWDRSIFLAKKNVQTFAGIRMGDVNTQCAAA